ncbi:PREDICTED: protein AF-9-like, partial [Rhagoletis zephyria]|uniref:protein AF-9-like n=1 Tax=Rhagoletis zephyria TaxID=28612 RepID=UPI0008119188
MSTNVDIEVQFEFSHNAYPKLKHTADGHTHDWTLRLNSFENKYDLKHFVEKVVFNLHNSFAKPKRVIKEPPYEITETGYASFDVIIEVFFRNKAEPRSIRFLYDLYIEMDKPVYKLRRERLTFKNPSKDFMKKLIMGGGTIM